MIFNMIAMGASSGGGGLDSTNALIIATVPAGSTVRAVKDGVVKTPTMWIAYADSTLEKAVFQIPPTQFDQSTPWTITATSMDGTSTASAPILVSTSKEYEVVLSYAYYFYKNGTSYNGFSPTSTFKNSIFTITENASTIGLLARDTGRNGIAWALPFENHGYQNLYAVLTSGTIVTTSTPYFGIYNGSGNVYDETNFTVKSQIATTLPTTVSVDVSNVSGGYIAFRLHNGSEIQVSEIYLSNN